MLICTYLIIVFGIIINEFLLTLILYIEITPNINNFAKVSFIIMLGC